MISFTLFILDLPAQTNICFILKMNHELMCKLNMHDTQVMELMGSHDFTQLQQQQQPPPPQQQQQQQALQAQQMLNYTMTETQNPNPAVTQHADNPDNNRTSRPIRRASRRTPQVGCVHANGWRQRPPLYS